MTVQRCVPPLVPEEWREDVHYLSSSSSSSSSFFSSSCREELEKFGSLTSADRLEWIWVRRGAVFLHLTSGRSFSSASVHLKPPTSASVKPSYPLTPLRSLPHLPHTAAAAAANTANPAAIYLPSLDSSSPWLA
ncbi:hypothetical protein E2C01_067001 [Portunus trituberculatus]|uniref:Uncharacterized protein n=1 Tax=Portunus trituberculatus TaxID=210409 RepID=A0A5B7HSF5_PORTR|nr:hypothetical protein [Portunus trituberculatus]